MSKIISETTFEEGAWDGRLATGLCPAWLASNRGTCRGSEKGTRAVGKRETSRDRAAANP